MDNITMLEAAYAEKQILQIEVEDLISIQNDHSLPDFVRAGAYIRLTNLQSNQHAVKILIEAIIEKVQLPTEIATI